jgi:hypothetical protein
VGSPHEYLLVSPVLLVGGVGHLLAAGALGQGGRGAAVLKKAKSISLFGGVIPLTVKLYRQQCKMSSSKKKFTCKGTLRQVFIRVNRLEIQSVVLVFSTQLCELLPL